MKRRIRLSESELRTVVEDAVRGMLREGVTGDSMKRGFELGRRDEINGEIGDYAPIDMDYQSADEYGTDPKYIESSSQKEYYGKLKRELKKLNYRADALRAWMESDECGNEDAVGEKLDDIESRIEEIKDDLKKTAYNRTSSQTGVAGKANRGLTKMARGAGRLSRKAQRWVGV